MSCQIESRPYVLYTHLRVAKDLHKGSTPHTNGFTTYSAVLQHTVHCCEQLDNSNVVLIHLSASYQKSVLSVHVL